MSYMLLRHALFWMCGQMFFTPEGLIRRLMMTVETPSFQRLFSVFAGCLPELLKESHSNFCYSSSCNGQWHERYSKVNYRNTLKS